MIALSLVCGNRTLCMKCGSRRWFRQPFISVSLDQKPSSLISLSLYFLTVVGWALRTCCGLPWLPGFWTQAGCDSYTCRGPQVCLTVLTARQRHLEGSPHSESCLSAAREPFGNGFWVGPNRSLQVYRLHL